MGYLLVEGLPLMREGGEAVARQNENGNRSLAHMPGQIGGGLLAQRADTRPLNGKARVLPRRTAYRERNPLAQIVLDFQVGSAPEWRDFLASDQALVPRGTELGEVGRRARRAVPGPEQGANDHRSTRGDTCQPKP